MNEPYIQLSGNLGGDPQLRYTPNGTPVLDFRVATTQRKRIGDNEWADGETLWFDVTCWKQLAENVAESLHKGDRVNVSGLLAQSSYTREDGTVATKLVINGSKVGVDLSRSTAKLSRTVRQSAGEAAFGYVHAATGEVTPDPVPGSVPFGDAVEEELEQVAA